VVITVVHHRYYVGDKKEVLIELTKFQKFLFLNGSLHCISYKILYICAYINKNKK